MKALAEMIARAEDTVALTIVTPRSIEIPSKPWLAVNTDVKPPPGGWRAQQFFLVDADTRNASKPKKIRVETRYPPKAQRLVFDFTPAVRRSLGNTTQVRVGYTDNLELDMLRHLQAQLEESASQAPKVEDLWSGKALSKRLEQLPAGSNQDQARALRAMLSGGGWLLWGPPGTGKTTVIVGAVREALRRGWSVLIASHTTRGSSSGSATRTRSIRSWRRIRGCYWTRLRRSSPVWKKAHSNSTLPGGRTRAPGSRPTGGHQPFPGRIGRSPIPPGRAGVGSPGETPPGSRRHHRARGPRHPSATFSGQPASQRRSLCCTGVPLDRHDRGPTCRIVDVADAVTDQKRALRPWLGEIFGLLGIADRAGAEAHARCLSLKVQYRFPSTIANIVNEFCYDGLLESNRRATDADGIFVTFVDTAGHPRQALQRSGQSWINPLGLDIMSELASAHPRTSTIGLVSPYSAHAGAATLRASKEKLSIECGTAHRFQGRQFDTVILDLVQDGGQPRWAAMADLHGDARAVAAAKLLNVGITRARRHLFIIGDWPFVQRAGTPGMRAISGLIADPHFEVVPAENVLTGTYLQSR